MWNIMQKYDTITTKQAVTSFPEIVCILVEFIRVRPVPGCACVSCVDSTAYKYLKMCNY